MFKEGIAHYTLLGGSSTHIVVHPLSISCSSWLGSAEDHNPSQQAGAYRGREASLSGVYTSRTAEEKEETIQNNFCSTEICVMPFNCWQKSL